MQEAINIITCKNGIVQEVKTFIINDDKDTINRDVVIEVAEMYFINLINEHNDGNVSLIDSDECLDMGVYSNHDGIDIYLSWSI